MVASTIGTVMEWYDFNLYGLASALIFGPLIFGTSSVGGTLASFATYAVGFAARPIGGVILGHLGDRVGRKRVLILTMYGMGISTALLGLLPTHAQVGVLAPILLVVLRIGQGIAVGGEFAGATLLTIENAPPGRRGLFGSIPAMGTGAGFVLASAVFGLVSLLPDDVFLTWGWRIPFFVSIGLVVFGLWLRRGIEETAAFSEVRETDTRERFPLLTIIRTQPSAVLRTMGITVSGFVFGYSVQAFAVNYAVKTVGVSRSLMLWGIALASALEIIAIPFWGWLSDKIGRKVMVSIGLVFTVAYILPFFALLETGKPGLIILALIIALPIAKDMVFGPQAALVAEQFDSQVRFSGVSAGREVGGAIFGGTAPFIATALVAATGSTDSIAFYIMAACVVTLVAVLLGRETSRGSLRGAAREALDTAR
ncbi:MFS transporter [Nakamurella sp. A5-74]|uniref:MFS transporter n=1 Tax=Nakamurella sp. A5-74 TaxID=3158264 RepID=A0AAU8DUG9_9ACTN